MAEGWLRYYAAEAGLEADIFSAGTEATFVKTEAIEVMREVNIDLSGHSSKTLYNLPDAQNFDLVITVCDQAKEACPVYPSKVTQLHLGFPDPSGKSLVRWREVRDSLGEMSASLVRILVEGGTLNEENLRRSIPNTEAQE